MSDIKKKLPIYQEISKIQKQIEQAKEKVKSLKLQPKYTVKDVIFYYDSFVTDILQQSDKSFKTLEKTYKMDFSLHYDHLTSQKNGDVKALNNATKTYLREEMFDLTVTKLNSLHSSFDIIASTMDKSIDMKDKPKSFSKGK